MNLQVKRTRRAAGFTMVEILVVVIIIGVLATMILPKFFGRVGAAKRNTAVNNLAEVEKAIEMFSYDYGRLPETIDELVDRPVDIDEEKWNPPTIKAKNLTDPWGREFIYETPGNHGPYDLYSFGADGALGGGKENEDICNW